MVHEVKRVNRRGLRQVAGSPALVASAVPTMVLDRDLRLGAVNSAFEQVTLQRRDSLVGKEVSHAFPDNPADPGGMTTLISSLERVLRRRERHHLGFIRYDIPDPKQPDVFLPRVWSVVNSPILEDRQPIGVLQQVEDLTSLALGAGTELQEGADPVRHLAAALAGATATLAAMKDENDNLQVAVANNRIVGVAIGLLMSQHQVSQDEAFKVLRLRSQHSNRKLRDIAEEFVDTGVLPAAPSPGDSRTLSPSLRHSYPTESLRLGAAAPRRGGWWPSARESGERAGVRHTPTCSFLIFHTRPCDCPAGQSGKGQPLPPSEGPT